MFFAAIPILGLILNITIHFILLRFFQLKLLKSIKLAFFFGLVSTCSLSYIYIPTLSLSDQMAHLLLHAISYSSLAYGYFHFINLGETARRVRIVLEFYHINGKQMSYQELIQHYSAKQMVDKRLKRLLDNHQIIEKDHKYLTHHSSVLRMSQLMQLLKRVLFKL